MNREQAEKWIDENKKEPYFSGPWSPHPGKYAWAAEENRTDEIPHDIRQHLKGIDSGYDTEAEAIEDLIQALMKRPDKPEVDVDVKTMAARHVRGQMTEYNPYYQFGIDCFTAGHEAAKRGELNG